MLDPSGGALAKQLPLFKLGLGGRAGKGTQWMSWITLRDEVGAIRFALDHDDVRGPVNLTAPAPVTNAAFTKALGAAVGRPTLLPVPRFVRHAPFGSATCSGRCCSLRPRAAPGADRGRFDFQDRSSTAPCAPSSRPRADGPSGDHPTP